MTEPSADRLVYADSSALVKLVIEEPESAALSAYLATSAPTLATSRIARVEVTRAVSLACPGPEARAEAERLLDSCLFVEASDALLREAAALASREVRTLDAIHLASALRVDADELLAYDERLGRAAVDAGLAVARPGSPTSQPVHPA